MVPAFQITTVLLLSLSCFVNGRLSDEFLPPEEDTILLQLGSQLRSLGKDNIFGTSDSRKFLKVKALLW